MNDLMQQQLTLSIRDFRLPRYAEITNVGLYLDQVTRFVNIYLQQAGCAEITPSMVSNYVKQKTIPGPVKKAYGADSIAYLIFVSFIKTVLAMEDIRMLEELQRNTYSLPVAYDYFCDEFENVVAVIFGLKPELEKMGRTQSDAKEILRGAILAAVQKIYLDAYLRILRSGAGSADAAGWS